MANTARGILIAGNWKMNHGPEATGKYFSELRALWSDFLPQISGALESRKLRACVIPPAVSLTRALEEVRGANPPVIIAAQNAHWEKSGAYTGELSGPLLQEIGINWVLVGHSERRQYFGETDETVRKRSESLLQQGFEVILCVGETRAERESGRTSEVLLRQLRDGLPASMEASQGRLIIAYEPVWAIGTGLTASPAQAEEAHAIIRTDLRTRLGAAVAERTQILYGGSVTPENVDSLLACPNVDGALVGGASLKPASFMALVVAGARA